MSPQCRQIIETYKRLVGNGNKIVCMFFLNDSEYIGRFLEGVFKKIYSVFFFF